MQHKNFTDSRQTISWDKSNFITNYGFNLFTQFGAAFISFFTIWWITKYCSLNILAIIVAIIAGSQTIALFTNWTLVAVSNLGMVEFIETYKISKTFSARSVILTINILIVLFFFSFKSGSLIALLKIPMEAGKFLLLHFVLTVILTHLVGGFQAVKLVRMQGLLLFFEKLLALSLILITAFFKPLTWEVVMSIYLFTTLIIISVASILLYKYFDFGFEISHIRKVVNFSLPLLPYSATAFLTTNYLDTFFIAKYLPQTDVAVYSIAYQFYGLWMQLPTILNGLILPIFITLALSNNFNRINHFIENHLGIVVLFWTLLSTLLAFLLTLILPYLFNINHSQLNLIIFSFIMGTTLALPNLVAFSPYLLAKKILFFSFPLSLITAVCNLFGNNYLIPKFGLIGCTYATVLSSTASLIASCLFMYFYLKIKVHKLLYSFFPMLFGMAMCCFADNTLWATLVIIISTGFGFFRQKRSIALFCRNNKKSNFSKK